MEWKDRAKNRRIHQGLTLEKVAQAVGVSAVSYTHLDVYKRQDRYQSPTEFEFENTQIPTRALSHRTGALKQSNS